LKFFASSQKKPGKKDSPEQSERGRLEMQRRIDEIKRHDAQAGQIPEAIDRAQQTIGKFGPDPGVTQLLQSASSKQDERQEKRRSGPRTLRPAHTLAAQCSMFAVVACTRAIGTAQNHAWPRR